MVVYVKFLCDVACQKLLELANVSRSYSKNNTGRVCLRHGVDWAVGNFVHMQSCSISSQVQDSSDTCTPTTHRSVFENTYFTFFHISKKHDFSRFLAMTYQKSQKVTKSIKLASKPPDVMGISVVGYVYPFITQNSQLPSFLCPHFWASCLMLVTVTYR